MSFLAGKDFRKKVSIYNPEYTIVNTRPAMTKLKAFSIHLSISASIFFVILYFIVFHWYPQPFFTTDGGWQGIRIIAGVDMVLGPLLTLIVFKPGKPSLKFDMSVIALIQTAALISGTWVVFKERPLAVVFADDKFRPVPYHQIIDEANISAENFAKLGNNYPLKVMVELPEDKQELETLKQKAFQEFRPLYLQGELYKKLDAQYADYLRSKSVDMAGYLEDKAEDMKIYQNFLKRQGKKAEDFLFIPLHSRYAEFIITMNPVTLEFIEALHITPPTKVDNTIHVKRPRSTQAADKLDDPAANERTTETQAQESNRDAAATNGASQP